MMIIVGIFISRRRSQLKIFEQFLINAKGIQRTNFLHKTGLSYKLFVDYLDLLLDKNLIEEKMEGKTRIYYCTSSGSKLLKSINEIIENLSK